MPEPHQVGPVKSVDLTRALLPWDGTKPHFLRMPDSEYLYLPCFTSLDKLQDMMNLVEITGYTIKQVDDMTEFLGSFSSIEADGIKVILDPHYVGDGKVRFTQVTSSANCKGQTYD
jgi:hypothetical protein